MKTATILRRLSSDNEDERIHALRTVMELGVEARPGIPQILAACHHADDETRAFALMAIARLSPDIPELQQQVHLFFDSLNDSAAKVQRSAIFGLGRLGATGSAAVPRIVALTAADESLRTDGLEALAEIAPNDGAALRLAASFLGDGNFVVARAAAALFAKGASPTLRQLAIEDVSKQLSSRNADERLAGALASRWLADRALVAHLTQRLDDDDDRVRSHAVIALGAVGPEAAPAVPVLIDLVERYAPEALQMSAAGQYSGDTLACLALTALGSIGPTAAAAAPIAGRMLGTPSIDLRWRAAKALTGIGKAAGAFTEELRKALALDPRKTHGNDRGRLWSLKAAIARALVAVDADRARVVDTLIELLAEDFRIAKEIAYQDFRMTVVQLLGTLGPEAAVAIPQLQALANHWHLDEAAHEALEALTQAGRTTRM